MYHCGLNLPFGVAVVVISLLLSLLPTSVCQHRAEGYKLCILKFKSFAPGCTEKP